VEPLRSPRSVSIEEPANRLRTYAVAINGSSKTGENFQSEYPALVAHALRLFTDRRISTVTVVRGRFGRRVFEFLKGRNMSRCPDCGCDLPSFQTLCSKCFDARDEEMRQASKTPTRLGLKVFVSLFMSGAVFLYGLHKSLRDHMTFTERVMEIFLWTLVASYYVVRVWGSRARWKAIRRNRSQRSLT
jgi:hypothetical protein